MILQRLDCDLSVCKLASISGIDLTRDFYFIGKTDEELSLVCKTSDVPMNTVAREDGWRGFRIRGELDFALVGILARLTGLLAEAGIGLFAVSTYNTDYVLVKRESFKRAMEALAGSGYTVE